TEHHQPAKDSREQRAPEVVAHCLRAHQSAAEPDEAQPEQPDQYRAADYAELGQDVEVVVVRMAQRLTPGGDEVVGIRGGVIAGAHPEPRVIEEHVPAS